ncbi:uridylate kinase [Phaffia rhodozyma]|uniref:Uridylate kinase n=1 Tax=Phaffia rhodozyma TaxID=264483 RepID=A0A0F7SRV9_PHARH|nr:uridylate kinase [Phaffia rhodozyma]
MAPTTSETPAFDQSEVIVIFVLGGPGVGKGTQCANLVRDYHFVHLSAGDLLRAEQDRPGSQYGDMIREYIREGQVVPMEVTVKLLLNAMTAALQDPPADWANPNSKPRFLVDGFPRKMDQAIKFDESVCVSKAVMFFSCTEEVMLERLMERGKTSGRADDNKESIVKRFRTFIETSMPVVDYYREKGKVYEIPAIDTKDAVYVKVREAVDNILIL